jgi:hypothetical protein
MRHLLPGSLLAVATLAGSASAVTFSFDAGSDADGLIFQQSNDALADHKDDVFVTVQVDVDDDGPGDPLVFEESYLVAHASLTFIETQTLPGDEFLHVFSADGIFSIWEDCGCRMMFYCEFDDALFSSLSDSPDAIGASATLFGEDTGRGSVFYAPGPLLMDIGITELYAPFDFTFELSNINGGAGAPITNGSIGDFESDSSYAGAAVVPTPTSAALLVLGGLTGTLRRRR